MSHSPINQGHPRFAELDGLRALAVASVILFHCDISGLFDAGFLGVDVFFAISGFIITAMLVKDYRDKGDFRFRAFYFRRLKRLLPPVVGLVLLATGTALVSDAAFAAFRADVPAALAYWSNVWQIVEKQSYFDTTPHVLKHLWSLAVEEQFYLVWPPLAFFVLKRHGPKATGVFALALAFASTAWMWYGYDPAIGSDDLNRLYLGTDTHAMGLFAGAALGCFWNPWARPTASPRARWGWRIAALVSLGVLTCMSVSLNPTSPAFYQGGFLLVPLLTGVVAYCTMNDRRFFVSRLLRTDLAQWLGSRSYSLYLVHWLVFVWLQLRGHGDFSNWAVLLGALAAVAGLSELMYRWVEMPSKRFNPRSLDNRRMAACVLVYMGSAWSIFAITLLHAPAAPVVASAPAPTSEAAAPAAPVAGANLPPPNPRPRLTPTR
ncbi:acyltransferase [Massilia sp. Se16.2.3]|uniref:acyltransferase family protein n=1 Tax=Massilia sp. Se16.2.3 TaxID=2709303 RepID=UPI001600E598|nr:acyltransferase [Massilia sp. Se16.2.3]QNB00854.1 acyltransferase [Massilia sp. Se16.2.3]